MWIGKAKFNADGNCRPAGPQARLERTLEMTTIEGIKTTIPLHLRILNDPEFVAGKLNTSFMERFFARAASSRLAEAV